MQMDRTVATITWRDELDEAEMYRDERLKKSTFKVADFGELVQKASSQNKEVLQLLGDYLAEPVKPGLTKATELLDRILEQKRRQPASQLIPLKNAVRNELKALRKKKECKSLSEKAKKGKKACKEAFALIADSLLRIVMAYREAVPEHNVKKKIQKIINDGFVEGNEFSIERVLQMIGRNFLNNIE
ncbi:unnamed protein product [Nippostrongylus brasiliensis]|uniref:Uncharacterized protein n=1 Tax=Nippostrongylus brasiliensis TaxID=27835 RepID=A0A0N4XDF6_NIPBR|nr:unnamed protein product [Nippostrongylus brasiliensis]